MRVRKLTNHVVFPSLLSRPLADAHQVQEKLARITGGTGSSTVTPRSSVDAFGRPSPTTPLKPRGAKAEDIYEILCNDMVLPLDMTLAAVRQYIWRQAAELTMYYRRRVAVAV